MTRSRVGMTLIEVMLAMVIGTAVMTVLAVTASRMLLSNDVAHQHVQTITALGRLGEDFRHDAHAASQVTLSGSGDAQQLTLTSEMDHKVIYQFVSGGVERMVSRNDQLRGRELFQLPGMRPLGWNLDEDRREVALKIGRLARPNTQDETLHGQFSILAALRNSQATP